MSAPVTAEELAHVESEPNAVITWGPRVRAVLREYLAAKRAQ